MLTRLLPGLAAPALFLFAGAGLLALAPRPLERSRAARAGFAYLLGLAWCTLTVWAASLLAGLAVGATSFVVAAGVPAAAGAVLTLWRRQRARSGAAPEVSQPAAGRRAPRWPAVVVASLFAVVTLALLADTTAAPVFDFDGRMTWGTLARYVQASESVLPGALREEHAYIIHPRYPLVMPLAQVASIELGGGGFDGYSVRPLYVLILPALLLAIWPVLVRVGGWRGAALALLLLGSAPALLWDPQVGPRGTFSDFPLAAFLAASAAVLLHPRARSEPWRGLLAGLLLAAAAGSKNEGLMLAPMVLGAFALLGRRRRPSRAVASAAAVLLLGLAMIVGWRAQIPNRNDERYFEDFTPSALVAGLVERAPLIADTVAQLTLDTKAWGLTFWVLPLLLASGRRSARLRPVRIAALWIAAELSMAAAAYAVVGDMGIIGVTWNRFLVQQAMPLALLTAATTRSSLRRLRSNRSG